MASITSSGIGSGLDIQGIVQQLVAAEGQPAERRFGRQEAAAQSRLSAYGTLKSALAEFRDQLDSMRELGSLLARKASSGDEELFTVGVDSNAVPARYEVEVLQLAAAQKLTSGAFADTDTAIGTGTLQFDIAGGPFSVVITEDTNTLAGIRDAINKAAANTGVAATIVNAEADSFLILSSEKTGAEQAITVTASGGDGGLTALEYDPGNGLAALTLSVAAQDALLRIDGLDVVSASNSVAGAIDGVTLELVRAAPGETAELDVDNDPAALRKAISRLVESYNELVGTFDQLTAFNADTEIAGPLLGDASLRSVRDQLRREMSTEIRGLDVVFPSLSSIGIGIELDGKMAIDDAVLDAALASEFDNVGRVFAGTGGFAGRLFDRVENFLDGDGLLATRTEGLNRTIERVNQQRERLGERLESLEARLLRQFSALDALVGQLSSTSNFLSQQLASLPTVGKSDNR